MGEDDLASRALIKLLADCIGVDTSAFPLPLISAAPTPDGIAAFSGAVDMLSEASTKPVDPIDELLAGRVPCIEFGPGGRVVVGAPRAHKVCGASASENAEEGGELYAVIRALCTKEASPKGIQPRTRSLLTDARFGAGGRRYTLQLYKPCPRTLSAQHDLIATLLPSPPGY